MTDASDVHNKLARDFVMEVGRKTNTEAELMVVVESVMLAAMLLLVRQHGVRPSTASAYMEAALHAATERFATAAKLKP